MKDGRYNNLSLLFWTALGLMTLFRALLSVKFGLCLDEGYYYYWSLFPQLSYLDHPPLSAWAMALSNLVLKGSIWTVRFWPLFAGTCFVLIGRRLARNMFDASAGDLAGILFLFSPIFMANSWVMTPDVLFSVFWAGAIAATWYALQSKRRFSPYWIVVGLLAGLGALAKYNMILFFMALGVLWFVVPEWRKKLFWGALTAGFVAVVVFMPALLWNALNGWISFRFQLGHGFAHGSHSMLKYIGSYLGDLLIIVSPLITLAAFWVCGRGIVEEDRRGRFLACFFWTVLAFFAVSALKTRVQANWPMFAFYSGIIAVAGNWPRLHQVFRQAAMALLLFLSLAAMLYMTLPSQYPLIVAGRQLDPRRIREFVGSEAIAQAVQLKKEELKTDFVLTQTHQLFGLIAFYAPELRNFLWLPQKGQRRFPWLNRQQWSGKNALIVANKGEYKTPQKLFEKVQYLETIDLPVKKNLRRTIDLYLGTNYYSEKDIPLESD